MDITYQWIRSRRKTIAIQIDREGQVIVRTPYGITKRQVEEFLDEKKDWILQTRQRVEKRKTEQISISEEVRRGRHRAGKTDFSRADGVFCKADGCGLWKDHDPGTENTLGGAVQQGQSEHLTGNWYCLHRSCWIMWWYTNWHTAGR